MLSAYEKATDFTHKKILNLYIYNKFITQ